MVISPQQIISYMKTVKGNSVSKKDLEQFLETNHKLMLHISNNAIGSLWNPQAEKFNNDMNMLYFLLQENFSNENIKKIEVDFTFDNNNPPQYPVICGVIDFYLKNGYRLVASTDLGAVTFER